VFACIASRHQIQRNGNRQIAGERTKDAGNLPNVDYNPSADTGIQKIRNMNLHFRKFE
jgi:hypothetical protein